MGAGPDSSDELGPEEQAEDIVAESGLERDPGGGILLSRTSWSPGAGPDLGEGPGLREVEPGGGPAGPPSAQIAGGPLFRAQAAALGLFPGSDTH